MAANFGVAKGSMVKGIIRIIGRVLPYAPPTAIVGASLLKLTIFEQQFLMLMLLIWTSVFFLYRAWTPQ